MSAQGLFTLAQAQRMLPGSVLIGAGDVPIDRVHTDTRSLRAGDLFVALRGERFDGHDFLPQLRQAGAAAVIAERGIEAAGLPGLQVADALAALQALAGHWRQQFTAPLIAVTGSNGKTTVTQMIAAILHAWHGDAALATQGNFNNHIGVPLTLLRLRTEGPHAHRAAVVELGMNHAGEIAQLAAITRPTVALVNNAQREHQEFMVSIEAVARENGAVIEAMDAAGTAVFPADDAYAPLWREMARQRVVRTFALAPTTAASGVSADVRGRASWRGDRWHVDAHGCGTQLQFELHVAGEHNVKNALAAMTAALAAGAPAHAIERGLAAFRPVKGRSALRQLAIGGKVVTLVDDTYNANPDSVRAAIDVLAALEGPGWLVLGDMGEVGDQGPRFHAEVGAYARERGIHALWTVGDLSAHVASAYGGKARHFGDVPALLQALSHRPAFASVLVKGSRFMGMERVVQALDAAAVADAQAEGASHAA